MTTNDYEDAIGFLFFHFYWLLYMERSLFATVGSRLARKWESKRRSRATIFALFSYLICGDRIVVSLYHSASVCYHQKLPVLLLLIFDWVLIWLAEIWGA
jgi:hypothetical protein